MAEPGTIDMPLVEIRDTLLGWEIHWPKVCGSPELQEGRRQLIGAWARERRLLGVRVTWRLVPPRHGAPAGATVEA